MKPPHRSENPLPALRSLVTDPQIVSLVIILALGVGALYFFGFQLIPFLLAFVIAYFLDAGVQRLKRRGLGHGLAVTLVYTVYLVVYLVLLAGPVQIVARRAVQLAQNLPANADRLLARFSAFPDPTLGLFPEKMRQDVLELVLAQMQNALGFLVSGSFGLISQVTAWVMFSFLVPLLVLFFLKDKDVLLQAVLRCLPRNRELASQIWREMEQRMGGYVRGKIWEILIVGAVSWVAFWALGFDYPVVFAMLSGFSALIPFLGMIGVAIPLFIQGYLQWGMTWPTGWLMIVYSIIHFVDGNILVPFMLAHAVKLHPVTILLAVLLFGSVWGFWGVLFAIPLATFARILLNTLLDHRDGLTPPADGPADGPAD
ncbi:MAG: AI-2E family transporter [SAR324 cluster bacterium]|nr:AI-2E family transporter [SAR324 cluster bacterium]